jgi:hypothetical protein
MTMTRPDIGWPGSDRDAINWLRERGGKADRLVEDLCFFANVIMSLHILGWRDLLVRAEFQQAFPDLPKLRQARTSPARIGALSADDSRTLNHELILVPLVTRVAIALAIVLVGVLTAAGPVQITLLVAMVPFLGVSTVTATVVAAAGVVFGLDHWWYGAGALWIGILLVAAMSVRGLVRRSWQQRGPLLGFLPVWTLVRLTVTGRLPLFATAVDLSEAGDSELAPGFIAACTDLPADCTRLLDLCRAMVALHSGAVGDAVTAIATAQATLDQSTDRVRGWCALQLAVILTASGRDQDARSELVTARSLLTGHRVRRWRRRAELLLIESDVDAVLGLDPEQTGGELSRLLREIHRLRLIAVRRHDTDLIERTELLLARLMLRFGDPQAVRRTLDRAVGMPDGRVMAGRRPDTAAADLVLRASVHGNEPAELAQARADATAALALVDAGKRPLAAVRARLVLAELDERDHLEDALSQAIAAVSVANQARYQFPSSRWRAQWALRQLDAYVTVLRLADRTGDSRLVAEIIEMARGEVLPAEWTAAQSGMLSLLDLTGGSSVIAPARPVELSIEEADAAAVLAGFSPVVRPPHAQVGSERHPWPEEFGAEVFDLNRELIATAGRCWYWSGVTVAHRYYWSVRAPDGTWSHGSVDQRRGSAADQALGALRASLPFPAAGEEEQERRDRVRSGALWRPDPPTREIDLLARVAAEFLPGTLRAGLLAETARNRKLVVSLPAELSYIPIAWLPVSTEPDVRVVECAAVQHVPAWAVLNRAAERGRERLAGTWPVRLAIINPSGDPGLKDVVLPPPQVAHVSTRPLAKTEVAAALEAMADERDWLLYLAGHLAAEPGKSSLHGLRVAGEGLDGTLAVRDLVSVRADGSQRYPVPTRALVVACDGIGLASTGDDRNEGALANEWLGFSAALILAGADHVCCTAYPVPDGVGLRNTAHILARELAQQADPCVALAEVQRKRLKRWRLTGLGAPLQWQSFVYLGRG